MLYLLYPPDPRTEAGHDARRASSASAKGSRSTSSCCPVGRKREEDVRFAYRLAESTNGRVFFTAGRDLDRYVVWDYLSRAPRADSLVADSGDGDVGDGLPIFPGPRGEMRGAASAFLSDWSACPPRSDQS